MHPRMQNASLLPIPELTPAADYIPLSPLSYEAAEEYAMGRLSALQGTAALGAGLHIAGSLLIVYGQTLVKVCPSSSSTLQCPQLLASTRPTRCFNIQATVTAL